MKTWQKVAIPIGVVVMVVAVIGILWFRDLTDDSDNPSEASLVQQTVPSTSSEPERATASDAPVASPAPTAAPSPAATTSLSSGADGAYAIDGPSSFVGYRVVEVLFGVDTEGVGRTSAVTGQMSVAGTSVRDASFEVDMGTVTSDENRRDDQFRGNLLDTANFPTATFTLTAPIELGTLPADNTAITATATGDLTLRGTTNSVTFDVQAQRLTGGTIQVVGNTDIVFADYGIPRPDAPGITTQDHGLLEFDLRFVPA